MKHLLAHRDRPAVVMAVLMRMGAACTECGHGTRVTSKRWARCKRCGHRVRRRTAEEIRDED